MGLTSHQQQCLAECVSILEREDRLLIEGSAGVGKTYLLAYLLKEISSWDIGFKQISCVAPTNKAVGIFRRKIADVGLRDIPSNFQTIHNLLRFKPQIDERSGEYRYLPREGSSYHHMRHIFAIIVDEASMLSRELISHLESLSSWYRIKVVYCGDFKQINPIGERESPVFSLDIPRVELTEIIRQKEGNPLIRLSQDLSLLQSNLDQLDSKGHGYSFTSNMEEVFQILIRDHTLYEHTKFLAWTNSRISSVNALVRERLYKDPSKIELGEHLLFCAPYKGRYHTNYTFMASRVDVISRAYSTPITRFPRVELKLYEIWDSFYEDTILVLHEDSELEYRRVLSLWRKRCKELSKSGKQKGVWRSYYDFVETFARVTYDHAISVHKSQGSSYRNVILDYQDIMRNRNSLERQRLLYTAVTRASDSVIIFR